FALGDVSPEPAEFPPNFAFRDVSYKTAESIPTNFALGDVSSETAESIPPNFRRISYSGCFRRNGRINPAELRPIFALGDISDKTTE
ncbi:MAG: hypothetical protein Q8881_03625, partial [Sweet potato little leaf phytoplasma]|nr:hypothetical protein [Sweet potato little leaf phytoplasma]